LRKIFLIEFVGVFRSVRQNFFAGEHAGDFAFAFHEFCANDHVEMTDCEEDNKPSDVVMNVMAHHFAADKDVDPAEERTEHRRGICHKIHCKAR